ncbi:MAG: hypothetical protein ACRCYU_05525, partial [Nocardioides sp.]
MRALARWIKLYDDLPEDGLTAPGSDQGPARRRFAQALTRVAELEAQAIAFTLGMADAPDVPALADPVIRMLDVPYQTTNDWTDWYSFTDAAPDLYARLIELSYRCGGYGQLEQLVDRFKVAWDSPERRSYWPPTRRVGVVRAAAHLVEAAEWCAAELETVESLIVAGNDPHARASTWLEIAKARSEIGDRAGAIRAVGNAHRDGWGPAQHHDDNQLVTWLAWLVETVRTGEIDQETFLNEARTYARRLVVAADGAEGQASEAAGDLVKAVFAYDPGLAADMGETLCNRGVISEVDMVLSIVKGAAESSEVKPELVAPVLTQLLMPLSTDTSMSIEELLVGRSAHAVELTEQFARARAVWSAPDSRRSDASAESESPDGVPEPEQGRVVQLPTMLGQMRIKKASEVTQGEMALWSRAIAAHNGVVQRVLGVELLGEAERLALAPTTISAFAGLAASAGAVEQAEAALSRILARTKAYGWMRHYDGGSRVTVFEAAIQQAGGALVDLAAHDLASLVASRTIGGDFYPRDLKRFAQLFGGTDLVARCWADIRA